MALSFFEGKWDSKKGRGKCNASRTEKTICLAVSPALKFYGIPRKERRSMGGSLIIIKPFYGIENPKGCAL